MSLHFEIKNSVLIGLLFTCLVGWLNVEGQVGPTCNSWLHSLITRINGGGSCEGIQCQTGLDRSKCPEGSVLEEDVAFCNCCPGCVKYLHKYTEACDDNPDVNGIYDPACTSLNCPIIFQCPRGLECRVEGGFPTCHFRPIPPSPTKTTLDTKSACPRLCFVKKALIEFENDLYKPTRPRDLPSCTEDGTFAPKQCKGEDCFCVDDCGNRLFGRELRGRDANMTCGCTTKVHALRQKGLLATLHCKENGDFEKLQCDSDSGLCYCVDEITGETTGEVLPEMHFKLLPCYNGTIEEFAEDGRYLRVCESEWVAGQKISQEAKLHGGNYNPKLMRCDYDGGFAPMFSDTVAGQDRCVHRSGVQITPYFREYNLNNIPRMDCQCARDRVYKARQGVTFLADCQADPGDPPPGSYKFYRINENFAYCVDTDGYQFGPDVNLTSVCCLDKPPQGEKRDCTNPSEDVQCGIDPPAPYQYKPCVDYRMGRTNFH